MSLNIDLKKFMKNLSKKEVSNAYPSGVFKVIDAVHNYTNSSDVDWDSFTLTEVELAMSHATYYEHYESENFSNEQNAIHEFLLNMDAISMLKLSKPVKLPAGDIQFF
ncbi:MAG: hypothetical protein ACE3L7_01540 [Candidatus Pristimantibacillus sp.]